MKRNSLFAFMLLFFQLLLAKGPVHNDRFIVWQLPMQDKVFGSSYVIKTDNDKLIVIDGGDIDKENYLRGFIGALDNHVDCWFVTHPHDDHMGALTKILEDMKDITISRICESAVSDSLLNEEPRCKPAAVEYYASLKKSNIPTTEVEPGMIFTFGHTTIKILGVKNEDFPKYNNSSIVMRVWDPHKSILFLGDAQQEEGDRILNGPYRKDLDCDYVQMAHHGQNCVKMDFYRAIKFKACLWPTTRWIYDNDLGKGFNTGSLTTLETRKTMEELGIKKQYFAFDGLTRIE